MMRDDCRRMGYSERPPLCGTSRCPCDRQSLGGFGRWDSAADVHTALEKGWITLAEVPADVFSDVRRVQETIASQRSSLMTDIASEARARGKDRQWAESEFARLTGG